MMQTRFLSSRSAFSFSGSFGARHFTNPPAKLPSTCRLADVASYLWFLSITQVDAAETVSNLFIIV